MESMNPPSARRNRAISPRMMWVGIAGFGLLAVALFSFRGSPEASVHPLKPVAMTVTTALARSVEWPELLSAAGPVEAWQEAIIGSQSSELRLAEVHVNVGDAVRKGDVLARFDDRMLRAEESQLLASLVQAEATASQAEINKQRALQQRDSGGISEQDILSRVTQAQIADAQVAAIRAQLAAKRLQLDYTRVRAPDDGVISARQAAVGAVTNNGQELFRLILLGRLEWRGELTATQLMQVKEGQQVQVALPNGQTVAGQVRKQAPSLDSGRRLGIVYVDLPAGSAARAGMYAKGSLVLRQSTALVVPAASVVIRDGRSYVFTLAGGSTESTKVHMTAVSVGRRSGGEVEVSAGVSAGTNVVEQGAGFLDDGDIVAVSAPEPSLGAAR